jgi:hypothetical protein
MFYFFFWWYWSLNSRLYSCARQALNCLRHSSRSFCDGFLQDRVWRTICLGWLRTSILIFAFCVAMITGVSHWCQTVFTLLSQLQIYRDLFKGDLKCCISISDSEQSCGDKKTMKDICFLKTNLRNKYMKHWEGKKDQNIVNVITGCIYSQRNCMYFLYGAGVVKLDNQFLVLIKPKWK